MFIQSTYSVEFGYLCLSLVKMCQVEGTKGGVKTKSAPMAQKGFITSTQIIVMHISLSKVISLNQGKADP